MQCTTRQRQAVLDQVMAKVGEVIADLIEKQVMFFCSASPRLCVHRLLTTR